MGLDNGIRIENWRMADNAMPNRWFEIWDKEIRVEPIYMRKWWGVRTDIVSYLQRKLNITEEESSGYYLIAIDDIDELISIYKKWNNKAQWQDGGSPIWSWRDDHISRQIRHHIRNLKKLKKIMRKYPDLEVVFYDSY